jgi:hypothetical protein
MDQVKIDLSHHPLYDPNSPPKEDQDSLEFVLWENLAKAGLLIGPGFIFSPEFTPLVKIQDATARRSLSEERLRYAHFRISYSDSDVSSPVIGSASKLCNTPTVSSIRPGKPSRYSLRFYTSFSRLPRLFLFLFDSWVFGCSCSVISLAIAD